MGMIDRLASMAGFERRSAAASPSWAHMSTALGNGPSVNERIAENLSTVTAAVSAISGALAMVPFNIYQRSAAGRVEVYDHPLRAMIDGGPNQLQTWPEMIEAHIAGALLSGNGLIEIERDGAAIIGLRHIPWGLVSPLVSQSGRLVYDVTEQTGIYGAIGRTRRLLGSDVVHLRDRSDDGILGRSRLSRSSDTVDAALQANTYARSFLTNSSTPAGAITVDGKITPEQMEQLRKDYDQRHSGPTKAGRVMILASGLKFEPYEFSPEDSELLASRKFSVEEICRLFQVPPPLVQDYSHNTFTNSEAAGRWFAQFTLGPWARKIETAMSRAFFAPGSGFEIELDLSAFLRGDPQTRWAAHKIAVDAGILDADEIREIEGFNPRGKVAAVVV